MKVKILILLILTVLLTGCWSKKELNETTLITSMAIDKEDDEYMMSLLVVVPSEATVNATGRSSPASLFTAKSKTLCDTFRKMTTEHSRIPNLAHIQNIIISEEVAKEGIASVIDSIIRDNQIRPTTFLFISKGIKASEVLKINTSMENNASTKIYQLIKNAESNYSLVHSVNIITFINNMISDDKEAYLPGIEVIGDIEKGSTIENSQNVVPSVIINLTPYAVFKKDKFVGWLDDYTSKGVNLLLNEVKNTMVDLFLEDDDQYSFEITGAKTKIKYIDKKKKPTFNIDTKIQAIICEANCTADLTIPKNLDKLEMKLSSAIEKHLEETIKTLQTNYNSDIIGFGSYIHRKNHKLWKKIKKDWDNVFPNIDYKVNVEITVLKPGSLIDPLKRSIKK